MCTMVESMLNLLLYIHCVYMYSCSYVFTVETELTLDSSHCNVNSHIIYLVHDNFVIL